MGIRGEPFWDLLHYDYRVKPEPKIIYVNEYTHGVVAHESKEVAIDEASSTVLRVAVPYKEVIES